MSAPDETDHTADPVVSSPDQAAPTDGDVTEGDITATDHPTGVEQAAENVANESPA